MIIHSTTPKHRLDAAPGPDAMSLHPTDSPKHRARCAHPWHLARRHFVVDTCLFLTPVSE